MLAHRVNASAAQRSFAHGAALALVWLTMATSAFVFSEPCPTDLLAVGLIVLLPAIGLVRFTPALALPLIAFTAIAATGLIAVTAATDTASALMHTLVSLYLALATLVFAAFIAMKPDAHLKLVFNGLTFGAAIAAAAGVLGYFGMIPGAEMFTKFGRATGTFKDPNVFGPFLVPPALYMIHTALNRPLRRAIAPIALAGLFALAVMLSFSRGAWVNLAVALAAYLVLSVLTSTTVARQRKLILLSCAGVGAAALMVLAATQVEQVGNLMNERASVTQDYDVGPEGRFGGQQKAISIALENPLGIGAAQFTAYRHHEEVHNVYLSMVLNAGWIGGAAFAILNVLTVLIGVQACFERLPAQPLLIIAVAALIATVGEGAIIDTDHWRHFYLQMAMVWGVVSAPHGAGAARRSRRIASAAIA